MKRLVAMQEGLHVILARRHVAQAPDRVAECGFVDRDGLFGFQAIDIDAKDHLRARSVVDLHPGLSRGIVGKQKKQTSVERLRAQTLGECDRELGSFRCLGEAAYGRASRGQNYDPHHQPPSTPRATTAAITRRIHGHSLYTICQIYLFTFPLFSSTYPEIVRISLILLVVIAIHVSA